MPEFIVGFTRSDTLNWLPSETIELEQEEITMGELMEAVELRRSELSKKIGVEALFVIVAQNGNIINYNAHNL